VDRNKEGLEKKKELGGVDPQAIEGLQQPGGDEGREVKKREKFLPKARGGG